MQRNNNWLLQVVSLTGFSYLSQFLSVLALPYITRIFTPSDFGHYASFVAVVAVVGVFSTCRYYLSVALPKADRDARDIVWGGVVIAFTVSIVFLAIELLAAFINSKYGLYKLDQKFIICAQVALPLSIFFTGLTTLFSVWFIRIKKANVVGVIRLFQTMIVILSQVVLYKKGFGGAVSLIIGMTIGQGMAVLSYCIFLNVGSFKFYSFDYENTKKLLWEYSYLPKMIIQTELVNVVAKSTMPIMIVTLFGSKLAGLWYLCNSIIGSPIGVITGAVWQVAHSKLAAEPEENRSHILEMINKCACYLFALPIVIIVAFREYAHILFGERWQGLEMIIPVYSFMVFINSISNTVSYFTVFNRRKAEAIFNVALSIMPLIVLVLGGRYLNGLHTIYLYCIFGSAMYLCLIGYWARMSKNEVSFFKNLFISGALNIFSLVIFTYFYDSYTIQSIVALAAYVIIYSYKLLGSLNELSKA